MVARMRSEQSRWCLCIYWFSCVCSTQHAAADQVQYNILVPVALGQFGLTIEDSREFVAKLVGTLRQFTRDELTGRSARRRHDEHYRNPYQLLLPERHQYAGDQRFCRDVTTCGTPIAEALQEFGIKLHNLYFENINVPEDDPSIAQLRKVLNQRLEMDVVGYSYQQDRSLNILEGAADRSRQLAAAFHER